MAGNKQGGLAAYKVNIANDPDFYRKIGAKGGKNRNPRKGFGSMDKAKISEAGAKGGSRSIKGHRFVGFDDNGNMIHVPA